ncbi:recombinase family protein [Thalassotalea sp. PS06]|uniref:recombinase family protein n=1 Tax=Thalassotalea sp. PS06 TaxID=2594005 RepID=UPI00116432DB|nr:recombinase family protein [Thalassotalea sp. PS06]QDP00668.1 recombinase family protein [Thalassotalea sp. PS06]
MKIGYIRVSTDDQLTDLQSDALSEFGCDKIYTDKITGKSLKRPELEKMLDTLRPGDVVVVWRLDRLGRSLKDLIELMESFKQQNIQFVSLQENIDTTNAMGELVFHLFASIAQFERQLISERTKAGLKAARARGRKGGRKPALSKQQIQLAHSMLLDPNVTKVTVAKHLGVSRPTLDKALSDTAHDGQQSIFQK